MGIVNREMIILQIIVKIMVNNCDKNTNYFMDI